MHAKSIAVLYMAMSALDQKPARFHVHMRCCKQEGSACIEQVGAIASAWQR